MNPNYLFKDELLYELAIRGFTIEGDVPTLRKVFRYVVSVEQPRDLSYLKAVGVNDLYATTASKVAELQVLAN
jgi:pullulanase/glycogen debranching enzyme